MRAALSLSRGVAAARAVYHATRIAHSALSVTARWASEGRVTGSLTGEANHVAAAKSSASLPAAAGSERSSASSSRATAAVELRGGPAEAAAEPEAGAPSAPWSEHVLPLQGATARPIAANAPADEVAATVKHAAADTVPLGSATAGLHGLDGSSAVDAAAGAGSASASSLAPPAAVASGAPAASAALQLYVQREGGADWGEISVGSGTTVAGLKEEIARKLPSLQGKDLDTISLHVAQVDENTGAVLRVEEAALPSRKALAALPALQSGASIVVKVAGAPAMPVPDDWMRDQVEGVSIYDPTIVMRENKCRAVFDALSTQPVRLVRSPPGSGKTSLGTLLARYAERAGRKVQAVDMNLWVASEKSLGEFWKEETGAGMAEALHPRKGAPCTYIIDEAQLLYALGQDHPFWRALKAINAAAAAAPQQAPRVQVVLLAVYGLRARTDQVGTPIEIPSAFSMSLLRLDLVEAQAFFGAYNATCKAKGYPPISIGLQAAMQRICNSHVGLLRACVRLFRSTFKGTAPITPEQEADFVASRLVNLGSNHDLRALPVISDVQPAEAAEIRRVALAGEEGVELTETELRDFPRMLITVGLFDMEPVGSNVIIRFSSPAMRTHALRYLFSGRPRVPLDEDALSSGHSFVREVIKRMRQDDLKGSSSKSADGTLLERQYQMSFYAAAISALPRGVHISPDYGKAAQPGSNQRGYVDFYVNGSFNIGVELTRDGQELKLHADRFVGSGLYAPLKLKSWAVVDFRQTTPRLSTLADHPGCTFVVLSTDFSRATIMQHGHADEPVDLLRD